MQEQIIVVSARNTGIKAPAGYSIVRVDRTSALGNPWIMENKTEKERNYVCDQYKAHFSACLNYSNHPLTIEFYNLLERARRGEKLALECWCAPKRCHADTIRNELYYKLAANVQI